jgi:hypothetical protein
MLRLLYYSQGHSNNSCGFTGVSSVTGSNPRSNDQMNFYVKCSNSFWVEKAKFIHQKLDQKLENIYVIQGYLYCSNIVFMGKKDGGFLLLSLGA